MKKGFGWLLTHLSYERASVTSRKSLEELVGQISSIVTAKPSRYDDALISLGLSFDHLPDSEETHSGFVDDWRDRGEVAIRSRGLYGYVNGTRFWLEVATGYEARMALLPRLSGEVSSLATGGSTIDYRLSFVQRNRAIAYLGSLGSCLLFIFIGLLILLQESMDIVGLVPIGVGIVYMVCLNWDLNRSVTLAIQLAERLRSVMVEIANN